MWIRLTTSLFCALLPALRAQTGTVGSQSAQSAGAVAGAAAAASQSPGQATVGLVTAGTSTNGLPAATAIVTPVTPIDPTILVRTTPEAGETTLALDIEWGIRYVPPARITVPAGDLLRLTTPAMEGTNAGEIQWKKNGQQIPGAKGATLVINAVQGYDAGIYQANYQAVFPTLNREMVSQSLVLGIGPIDRLLNLSTRLTLAAGPSQNVLAGFVVASTSSSAAKKLIVRAVGPSLAAFGVANPLKHPVLRIYKANGDLYQNGYVYPAIVGGATYETDLADALARSGAFPIPSGTDDAVTMMPFLPGSYTAEVTSGDLTGGMVLLEIYEVP